MDYLEQAEKFLSDSETKMDIKYITVVTGFPFDKKDTLPHKKYLITLERNGMVYKFPFYDSYQNFKEKKRPTPYSVLACVEKYDVGDSVLDFASEFGYDISNRNQRKHVEKIFNNCKKMYNKLNEMFGPYWMKKLGEIA